MGFEPTTPFGAPDFESGRWPIRLPSFGAVRALSTDIIDPYDGTGARSFLIYRPPLALASSPA